MIKIINIINEGISKTTELNLPIYSQQLLDKLVGVKYSVCEYVNFTTISYFMKRTVLIYLCSNIEKSNIFLYKLMEKIVIEQLIKTV